MWDLPVSFFRMSFCVSIPFTPLLYIFHLFIKHTLKEKPKYKISFTGPKRKSILLEDEASRISSTFKRFLTQLSAEVSTVVSYVMADFAYAYEEEKKSSSLLPRPKGYTNSLFHVEATFKIPRSPWCLSTCLPSEDFLCLRFNNQTISVLLHIFI